MNLFQKISQKSRMRNSDQTVLTSIFTWSGVALGLIFLVGMITWFTLYSSGVLTDLNGERFNWEAWQIDRIRKFGIGGSFLVFGSLILRVIWVFRINKASKTFIFWTYGLYILGQGLGFGILFSVLNSPDLLAIFGITSILFVAMATIGWFAKNLNGLLPFLMYGFIALLVLVLVNSILFLTGVYNNQITFLITMLSTVISLLYIAFDVWRIKRFSKIYQEIHHDPSERFRLVAFLGFTLLTDYIWLLWNIVNLYLRSKK